MLSLLGVVLIVIGILMAIGAASLYASQKPRHPSRTVNDGSIRHMNDGVLSFRQNDLLGAIANFSKSIDLDPDNGKSHEYLSFMYANGGHYHLAKKHADIALRLKSDYFAHIANAMYERYKQQPLNSLREAKKAIKANDSLYYGHYFAGIALTDLGNFRAARAACDRVQATEPNAAAILSRYISDAHEMRVREERKAVLPFPPSEVPSDSTTLPVSAADAGEPRQKAWDDRSPLIEETGFETIIAPPAADLTPDAQTGALARAAARVPGRSAREHLDALDLGPDASPSDIKRAFRNLVKVWHPDRFTHDPTLQEFAQSRLKKIHDAYRYLTAVRPRD